MPTTPPDELLKIPEVCKRLKFGRAKVYALIKSGDLHSVKVHGARRVRRTDLEAYISDLPVRPVATHPDSPGVPSDPGGGGTGTGPGREAA